MRHASPRSGGLENAAPRRPRPAARLTFGCLTPGERGAETDARPPGEAPMLLALWDGGCLWLILDAESP